MKKKKNIIINLFILNLLLLGIDQYLKFFAHNNQSYSYYLLKPYIGWEYLANPGIAFSLPIPNTLIIFITPLIILTLIFFLKNKYHKNNIVFSLGLTLIISGAISNFIDRVLFEITIDYIRIYTSVINLADIMIISGTLLLIFYQKRKEKMENKLDDFIYTSKKDKK